MSKHNFKLCSLNVRSINNKTLCIREFIIDNNLAILFLCEAWLGTDYDETSISEFLPPGYKLLHQARTNQRSGGVGIVYKGGLDVVIIDSSDGYECHYIRNSLYYAPCIVHHLLKTVISQ